MMPERPHPRLICDSCGAVSTDGNPVKHDFCCRNAGKILLGIFVAPILVLAIAFCICTTKQ
jgi:hypothetical protein